MLGPGVLVAPVVPEGATSREVYFPAGCWRGAGMRVRGPATRSGRRATRGTAVLHALRRAGVGRRCARPLMAAGKVAAPMGGACRRVARGAGALSVALIALASGSAVPAAGAGFDPSRDVNPFNGTEPGAQDFGTGGGAGNTFPGAVLPFGMVQLSPDTLPGVKAFGGGYTYSDAHIKGFSLRHMSGPGCAAYQDFPLTPTTAPVGPGSPAKPASTDLDERYASSFDHAHEHAAPASYDVTLNPGGREAIGARLAATVRGGVTRFTFPRRSHASVLLNASGSAMGALDAAVAIDPARREISGSATSGQFCYQRNRYRLYFAALFSRPFKAFGTWTRQRLAPGATAGADAIAADPFVLQPIPGGPPGSRGDGSTAQTGGYVTFDARAQPVVEVRVGISSVSVAGARANLRAETFGRSLGQIRAAGHRAWNRALGRIRVDGGTPTDRRRFYTQLYHALIHPSTFSDADGRYTGFDGRVHRAEGHVQYADFSGWDTYRTQMPLIAMLEPRRASDMVRSLLADAAQSGYLPKWPQANGHTHVMVGDPADPLIAGAWAFRARGFDRAAALAAMVKGATRYGKASTAPDYYERAGLPEYVRLGYVPHELNTDSVGQTFAPEAAWGSVSTTMEYALADFAIARLAAAGCDAGTYRAFMRRSGNWRNVFDPAVRYVQPRYADGSFKREGPTAGEGLRRGERGAVHALRPPRPRRALPRARRQERRPRATRRLLLRDQRGPELGVRLPRQRTDARHALAVRLGRPALQGAGGRAPRAARALCRHPRGPPRKRRPRLDGLVVGVRRARPVPRDSGHRPARDRQSAVQVHHPAARRRRAEDRRPPCPPRSSLRPCAHAEWPAPRPALAELRRPRSRRSPRLRPSQQPAAGLRRAPRRRAAVLRQPVPSAVRVTISQNDGGRPVGRPPNTTTLRRSTTRS